MSPHHAAVRAGGREPARGYAASGHVSGGGIARTPMRYEASIGADRGWPGFDMRADDVRTFLPLSLQFGLATEEEIDIDTLAERLREETVSHRGSARLPVLVSAWTRTAS